ncbi:hypothetical protein tb265_03290 [Gemmatimonadetes bacterium T265]|nr:hypothetical protein tb265_03290 [Gemmatimonadetes bacterium T265]
MRVPHVGMFAAKTHLSALVEQALAGEEIILTRHGEPVARIVPYAPPTPPPPRVFGAFAHLTPRDADWSAVTEPMSEDELRLWEGGDDDFILCGPEPA